MFLPQLASESSFLSTIHPASPLSRLYHLSVYF
jgi:hypothetical protein